MLDGQFITHQNNIIKTDLVDWGTTTEQIYAVRIPVLDSSALFTGTNIETVLAEIQTELNLTTTSFVRRDGTLAMTGNFNMGNNYINSVKGFNSVDVTTAQIEYVGEMDQSTSTTADVSHNSLTLTVPLADANVANNITLNNITQVTTRSLSDIQDLLVNKTFTMANKTLKWAFTNPAGGMQLEFTGAASGHSFEIKQTGGNPSTDMHLLHVEASDVDPLLVHLTHAIATSRVLGTNVSGDSDFRYMFYPDGKMEWGNGSTTADVNLYRTTTDILKTDDSFEIGASLTVGTPISDANIANDITLDNITQITSRSHTNLSDVGTLTHPQIDSNIATTTAHIATTTIHFQQTDIDHVNLQNSGTLTHAQIDSNIATSTAHISSTGTDHTYIDQDVTSSASPTFTGLNFGATTTINTVNASDDTTLTIQNTNSTNEILIDVKGQIISTASQTLDGKVVLTSASSSVMLPFFGGYSEDTAKGLYFLGESRNTSQTGFTDAAVWFNARNKNGDPLTTGYLVAFTNDNNVKFRVDINGNVKTGIWQGTAVADGYIASASNWNNAYSHISSDGSDHSFLNQSVTTTSNVTFNDVVISGDLIVMGDTTTLNVETVVVEDPLITLNNGEPGSDVSTGFSGIQVDRGSATTHAILFRASDDTWRSGEFIEGGTDNTVAIAHREDTPISDAIAYWDNGNSRFSTTSWINSNRGGTGIINSGITTGDILYSPNGTSWSVLGVGGANEVLTTTSGLPSWEAISTHDAVTLGTANGLSLSTQQLSLAAASTSVTGSLTATDWNTFNGKQTSDASLTSISGLTYVSGSYIALTAEDTYTVRTYAQVLSDIGAEAADTAIVKSDENEIISTYWTIGDNVDLRFGAGTGGDGYIKHDSTTAGILDIQADTKISLQIGTTEEAYVDSDGMHGSVYAADYADTWQTAEGVDVIPGKVYTINDKGLLEICNKRNHKKYFGVCTDIAGFHTGAKNGNIEICVAGFPLVYVDNIYKGGTLLTSNKFGSLTKVRFWEKPIAMFIKPEHNEIWNKKKVNGRCWVKILR